MSMASPTEGVYEGQRLRPRIESRPGHLHQRVGVRRELRPRQAARCSTAARTAAAVACGGMGEHPAASSRFGQLTLTSTAMMPAEAPKGVAPVLREATAVPRARRRRRTPPHAAPRCSRPLGPRSGGVAGGPSRPRRRCPVPAARRCSTCRPGPDRREAAGCPATVDRERLHDDCSEGGQLEVVAQLGPVARRCRQLS